ncbi:MAG: MBL fold metallo-hydrolase [Candidatus Marsarchaeota archaeon]|nr:MBL fold metallo-hydrolase [Candidatus Marsarchaeota archaeon]
MKITKFAHSCLLIEDGSVRLLFDPGKYSTKQNRLNNIDAVFVTHEHVDHYATESMKAIVANNPNVRVFTNRGVAALLDKDGIKYSLLEHGQSIDVKGVEVEAFGEKHAVVYPTIPLVANTGYLIAGRLFHPGDQLTVPPKGIELLALPVAGPWVKVSEFIDYAKAVKPKTCFPIHDASITSDASQYSLAPKLLEPSGIKYIPLATDGIADF